MLGGGQKLCSGEDMAVLQGGQSCTGGRTEAVHGVGHELCFREDKSFTWRRTGALLGLGLSSNWGEDRNCAWGRTGLCLGEDKICSVIGDDRSCPCGRRTGAVLGGGQELAQGRTGAVLVEDRSFTLGEDRSFT